MHAETKQKLKHLEAWQNIGKSHPLKEKEETI